MTTRTKVAGYIAGNMQTDRKKMVQEAAAWMVQTKNVRQLPYLVEDIARSLRIGGYVYARVTSARELDTEAKRKIDDFIRTTGAKEVEIEYKLDPGLIGGIKIELPGATLDGSVRKRLDLLVEGLQS